MCVCVCVCVFNYVSNQALSLSFEVFLADGLFLAVIVHVLHDTLYFHLSDLVLRIKIIK